jgi:hypothetical protein
MLRHLIEVLECLGVYSSRDESVCSTFVRSKMQGDERGWRGSR